MVQSHGEQGKELGAGAGAHTGVCAHQRTCHGHPGRPAQPENKCVGDTGCPGGESDTSTFLTRHKELKVSKSGPEGSVGSAGGGLSPQSDLQL